MSVHPKGTHLGGIRTVDDLKQRCAVDQETGCWHWRMAMCDGVPRVHYCHPQTGARLTGKGRRAALILERREALPAGHVAWAKKCCASADCCNPDHAQSGTKKKWGKWLTASGRVKNLPSKCAGARRAWDTRGRKITPEDVALIRSSDKSSREIAAEIGCSQYAAWSIRRKACRNEGMQNSSVWEWRP